MSAQAVGKLRSRISTARFEDCSGLVTRRLIKSDHEINYMHEPSAIADAAVSGAADVISPGIREADAAAEIIAVLSRGVNGKALPT